MPLALWEVDGVVSPSARAKAPRPVADLVEKTPPVVGDTPIKAVVARFERDTTLDALAVILPGGKIGLVSRARFFRELGTKFGYAVFENRPIALLTEEASVVEADSDSLEVIHLALQRESARIYDDVIVVRGGVYLGVVSMRSLMAHHKDLLASSLAEVATLDESNRQLQEIQRIQAEFVANMTHELRSPLNVMLGIARVMSFEEGLTDEQKRRLGVLVTRGQHLATIVNNLLDLSKLQSGVMDAMPDAIEPGRFLDEIVEATEPLLDGKPVRLQVRFRSLPARFVTDSMFLRRILDNLLSNAIKFTDAGMITLAAHGLPGEIVISVIDTGMGIRSEDMGRLFTRFGQLESTKTRRAGTGLGLAIVKGLVDALHGRLAVESQPGAGSTFTVVLPEQPEAGPMGVA